MTVTEIENTIKNDHENVIFFYAETDKAVDLDELEDFQQNDRYFYYRENKKTNLFL